MYESGLTLILQDLDRTSLLCCCHQPPPEWVLAFLNVSGGRPSIHVGGDPTLSGSDYTIGLEDKDIPQAWWFYRIKQIKTSYVLGLLPNWTAMIWPGLFLLHYMAQMCLLVLKSPVHSQCHFIKHSLRMTSRKAKRGGQGRKSRGCETLHFLQHPSKDHPKAGAWKADSISSSPCQKQDSLHNYHVILTFVYEWEDLLNHHTSSLWREN